MNRIDALLAELCPDGVEFRTLGEVVHRTSNIKWVDTDDEEFKYIDLTSVDRITHAIVETQTVNSTNAPDRAQQIVRTGDVIFGTTRPMLKRYALIPSEYDGNICSTGYCVLRPNLELVLPNFVFHLLGTETFYTYVEANERGASYPAISDNAVKAFRIPVPPLEVQRAIVTVLDAFTALEAELEAELEARRRQYHHYRDQLLSFDGERAREGAKTRRGEVRWATLGEVCQINRGRVISKDYLRDNAGPYPVYSSQTANDGIFGFIDTYDYDFESITWTTDGANAGSVFYHQDEEFSITNVCGLLRVLDNNQVITKFLYHMLGQLTKRHVSEGMGNPKLMSNAMSRIRIPIPSLAEQARIVAILDQFDALVNDLSRGLPAEIAARRQQYEHYRDRLLTFQEA